MVNVSDQLPDPLVPDEVDLRDFGFMPLDVKRLLTSETWIDAIDDPRIGHAAMSLWCEAWHQVPAGSLPDNDKVLYRLSMSPNLKEWQRVREQVLRGWVKASDGRLYHRVVVEKALESWAKKLAQRERTRLATEARERKRREREEHDMREREAQRNVERVVDRDEQRDDERNVQRNVERDVHQGTGTGRVKGQGEGEGDYIKPTARSPEPPAQAPTREGALAVRMRAAGVQVTSMNPLLLAWAAAGLTDEQADEVIARARVHKPAPAPIPARYIAPIVQDVLNPPAVPELKERKPTDAWWTSHEGIDRKARELGIFAGTSDTYDTLKQKCFDKIRQGEKAA